MSVTSFPYHKPTPTRAICALCKRSISLSEATVGPINAEGEVTLICNEHLREGRKFIDDLADFVAGERRKFFHTNDHNLMQFGVSPHVRSLH
jgi:hypothetical protein